MANREPRYSPEEAVRRGNSIYDQRIREMVEADNRGKYVAIDLDTGE